MEGLVIFQRMQRKHGAVFQSISKIRFLLNLPLALYLMGAMYIHGDKPKQVWVTGMPCHGWVFFGFFFGMFYQFLCVPHSRSSTQSWGSVLPSIVEMRDQNSLGCPLLFLNRNLGSFLCIGDRNPIHPQPLGSCGPLQE